MQIVIDSLVKTYGEAVAIDGLNLTLSHGMFGLLGPNGAGKSTLLQVLATVIAPTQGRVTMGAYDVVKDAAQIRRMVGYLPQQMVYYDQLTGEEFVDYIAMMKGMQERKARRVEVQRVLEVMHMSEHARKRLGTYSGGMKQRIGMAQALLGDPQFLIVDEPTVGLDPEERASLIQQLIDLSENRIVILSTHIVSDIEHACTTLGIMKHGKFLFTGDVDQLLHTYTGRIWQVQTFAEHRPYLQVPGRILKERVADGHLEILFTSWRHEEEPQVLFTMDGNANALPVTQVTPRLEDVYLAVIGGGSHG